MTGGDYIRKCSDEELAKLLADIVSEACNSTFKICTGVYYPTNVKEEMEKTLEEKYLELFKNEQEVE
jgi:ribosomal protein L29